MSILHSLYLAATHVTGPVFARAQRKALVLGKEDPARTAERWGRTDVARPDGPLVWFHGASVGETQSILPLVDALLAARTDVTVLITSTTRTSAQMLADGLPPRVIHQMAPYDTPRAVTAFLDHWRPDVAIWVESELWPRMLHEAGQRGIPRLLLNARVSERTARRWGRFPATARAILGQFDAIHVQEAPTMRALEDVGVTGANVRITGALKQDRPPLECNAEDLARMRKSLGVRDVWCAASTHVGEDELVLAAHRTIGGLLILVPRHAQRAGAIIAQAQTLGFKTAQRSAGEFPDGETDVYIADTMGEMGLWFRVSPVSFVGGSLMEVGGHNPYEAAQLGSAIVHGPHVNNFADIYDRLGGAGAARLVTDADSLAAAIDGFDDHARAQMVDAATDVVLQGGGATLAALDVILAKLPHQSVRKRT